MQIFFLLLSTGLMIVNGFTDAPNAIAGAVSSGTLTVKKGSILAAVCNFFGAILFSILHPAVGETVASLGPEGQDPRLSLAALTAGILACELYALAAFFFGIPTSESHGLVSGIAGATFALSGGFSSDNLASVSKILFGLLFSTLPAFLLACLFTRPLWRHESRYRSLYRKGEIFSSAVTAALHGAQDGGKLASILALGFALSRGESEFSGEKSLLPLFYTAFMISLGTLLGGKKIIEKIGGEMVTLTPASGLAADLSSGTLILLSTLFGLPISTTHAKVLALSGAGRAQGGLKKGILPSLALSWALNFPICFFLGFLMTKLFVL